MSNEKYVPGQEVSVELVDMKYDMVVADIEDGVCGYISIEEFNKERMDVYPGQIIDLFVVYYDAELNAAILSLNKNPDFCNLEKRTAAKGGDNTLGVLAVAEDTDALADFYMAGGEVKKAEEKYEEALGLRTGIDTGESGEIKWNISQSYRRLGDLCVENEDNDKAIDYYRKGAGVVEEFDQLGIEYQLHLRLGNLYEEIGEREKAIDFLSQAVGRLVTRAQNIIAREEKPDAVLTETAADVFYRLGLLYLAKEDREEAFRSFTFAETVYDQVTRDRGTVRDYFRLAEVYWYLGDISDDEEMFEKSEELLIQLEFEAPGISEITELLEKVNGRLNKDS